MPGEGKKGVVRKSRENHSKEDELVEPEYWVMRSTHCQYCGKEAVWNIYGDRGSDTMNEFHEEMGIDSHVHGWVYCSSCKILHLRNRNKYLTRNGYIPANELVCDHPQLKRLDAKRAVCIRVQHKYKTCSVYTVERHGWEVQKRYPHAFSCFLRHGHVWVRLVNTENGTCACTHLAEVLKTNRIPFQLTRVLRQTAESILKTVICPKACHLIASMTFKNRVDEYPVSVGRHPG